METADVIFFPPCKRRTEHFQNWANAPSSPGSGGRPPAAAIQPAPAAALALLKDGNARFAAGKATHPHADAVRLKQAGL